jgi:hypothetical protein
MAKRLGSLPAAGGFVLHWSIFRTPGEHYRLVEQERREAAREGATPRKIPRICGPYRATYSTHAAALERHHLLQALHGDNYAGTIHAVSQPPPTLVQSSIDELLPEGLPLQSKRLTQ